VSRRTYSWDGTEYPSVTSILGTCVAKPGLIGWAAKVSAQATADALAGGAMADVAVAAGKAAPTAGRDAGGARGTDVHRTLHHLALDLSLPTVGEAAKPYVTALIDWWADERPQPIAAEAIVVSRSKGYAGTLDAIWEVDGRRVIVDAKTSTFRGPEEALQLAAYRYADVIALPDGSEEPMPTVDAACVLAVTPDSCRLIDVDADEDAWLAFRGGLCLARWMWGHGA